MRERPIIKKYDCTIVPEWNPLFQRVIEVDAAGEEEACEFVRSLFRGRVHVTVVTAHRERRVRPAKLWVNLGKVFGRR